MIFFLLRKHINLLIIFITLLLQFNCSTKSTLLAYKELQYPSGSAIEFFQDKLYLVGDDASHMLVLNLDFDMQDSIQLLETKARRIPKEEKPDFESITFSTISGIPYLVILGSGSFDTVRNSGLLISVKTQQETSFELDSLYSRFLSSGIKELNIESITKINDGFIIGNRGNTSYPENHLIFISDNFWNPSVKPLFKIIKIEAGRNQNFFQGISGLSYSSLNDDLILSISTENTPNAYDDGEIGKSYLWIIKNFSSKRDSILLKPDVIIDLNELDKSFTGHKIESVCIVSADKNKYELVLVADDDKGTSLLFRIRLTISPD